LPIPEKTTEIPIDVRHNNSDLSTDSDSGNDVEVSVPTPLRKLRTLTLMAIHWTPLLKVKLMVPKKKTLIFLPKNMPVWLFWP